MRHAPNIKLERLRVAGPPHTNNGAFRLLLEARLSLRIIVSDGSGWDHVSVSLAHRCPTWEEMCAVKELCFRDDEVAMQLHPAKKDHINFHQFCLHLWRPQTKGEAEAIARQWEEAGSPAIMLCDLPGPIPLPPGIMIAPSDAD